MLIYYSLWKKVSTLISVGPLFIQNTRKCTRAKSRVKQTRQLPYLNFPTIVSSKMFHDYAPDIA